MDGCFVAVVSPVMLISRGKVSAPPLEQAPGHVIKSHKKSFVWEKKDASLMKFMYLVFTRTLGESYCR